MASIDEYAKKRKEREKTWKLAQAKSLQEQEERKRNRGSVRGKRLTDKSNADAAAFGMAIKKASSPAVDVSGKQHLFVFGWLVSFFYSVSSTLTTSILSSFPSYC